MVDIIIENKTIADLCESKHKHRTTIFNRFQSNLIKYSMTILDKIYEKRKKTCALYIKETNQLVGYQMPMMMMIGNTLIS